MLKITTDTDGLVFIGTADGEEYYLDLREDTVRGWSFMGLRPATEEELRERARDSDPLDYLGISRADFEHIERYFDTEAFANDMEDDWLDRHDSQAERENEDGETLYLGFGSGQDIFNYFKENNINKYEDYLNHFEDVGLEEEKFDALVKVIKLANTRDVKLVDVNNEPKEEHKIRQKEARNIKKILL